MSIVYCMIVFFITMLPESTHTMHTAQPDSIALADASHISGLLQLQHTAEQNSDHDKIVLLPRMFRQQHLEQETRDRKLFVSCSGTTITGCKKLYVIDDPACANTILYNELRIDTTVGHYKEYRDGGPTSPTSLCTFTPNTTQDLLLYNGADFTSPTYRKQGINSKLTAFAFEYLISDTMKRLETPNNQIKRLVLLFGLTAFNAGKHDHSVDRTTPLAKKFDHFVRTIENYRGMGSIPIVMYHFRYPAFMPTFDPTSSVCAPLPDAQAIPGYGNLLVYTLHNVATKKEQ
jgi:hypothetical protein